MAGDRDAGLNAGRDVQRWDPFPVPPLLFCPSSSRSLRRLGLQKAPGTMVFPSPNQIQIPAYYLPAPHQTLGGRADSSPGSTPLWSLRGGTVKPSSHLEVIDGFSVCLFVVLDSWD